MIFGHNYFITEPIFKLFVTIFRTHELQKDDMVIVFLWCFRKVRFRKMQFLKDGVQTVGGLPVILGRFIYILCKHQGGHESACLIKRGGYLQVCCSVVYYVHTVSCRIPAIVTVTPM